jgi:endonuclease YncB( thermonuclease family)
MFLQPRLLSANPGSAGVLLAAVTFALGLGAGASVGPLSASRSVATAVPVAAGPTGRSLQSDMSRMAHPAEVLRVLDGDTFEARVRIWPGMDVTTRVRLRGIDAPEMHARCDDEYAKAIAARDALARILAEGAIAVSGVGQDKYGGRVDADVSTAQTQDVAAALLSGGFARAYDGGKRRSWCG